MKKLLLILVLLMVASVAYADTVPDQRPNLSHGLVVRPITNAGGVSLYPTNSAGKVTGLSIVPAVSGGTTNILPADTSANSNLDIEAKGNGTLTIGGTSTGTLTIGGGSNGILSLVGGNSFSMKANGVTVINTNSNGNLTLAPAASSNQVPLTFTTPSQAAMTASTEYVVANIGSAGNARQHATGALTLNRDFLFTGSYYSFVGASTVTDLGTISYLLPACGTNATCTNVSGILHQSTALTGTPTNSYGLNISADTGATNNYAAVFQSGNVGIGTAAPKALVHAWGGSVVSNPSTLTISTATFTPVAVAADTYRVVLTSACPCTIANPTGTAVDGQRFLMEIWQDGTGSRTIGTWGTNYDFGTAGAPTLTTTASKGDLLGFTYSAQNSKYLYLGVQQGM